VFRAECKDKKKTFSLNLQLYSEINADNSSWSMSSVGRSMVTLRKLTSGTWPRLLNANQKLAQMHIWWAMREKYEKENEDFDKNKAKTQQHPSVEPVTARPDAAADGAQSVPVPDLQVTSAPEVGSDAGKQTAQALADASPTQDAGSTSGSDSSKRVAAEIGVIDKGTLLV
jgi:hypothetical protein